MTWTAADVPDQAGRTALVTGANSGLGLATSVGLAAAGARVLMACRDRGRGVDAVATVRRRVPHADVALLRLDLASLASVREAAAAVPGLLPATTTGGLDVLVNNAGVMATPFRVTEDGFEQQIGTNHLGPFALTGLLLPLLLEAPAPRVVTVSSVAHRSGRVDVDDLSWERRSYRAWSAYGQSKLANLLFTRELARRSEEAGLPLLAVAAHPGWAATNLQYGTAGTRSGVGRVVARAVNAVVGQSAGRGALPSLYAATAPQVRNGEYDGPDGVMEQRGGPEPVGRSAAAEDDVTARALWRRSEELTGVRYPEPLSEAA